MTSLSHMEVEVHNYRDLVTAFEANLGARARGDQFFHIMLDNGVLMARPGFCVLATAPTEADIDRVCEVAHKGLRSLAQSPA